MFDERYRYNESIAKTALSALGLSVLLSLSACSSDKEADAVEPAVEETVGQEPVDNTVVAAEPVAPTKEPEAEKPEVLTAEPSASVDTAAIEVNAEPEVLAADAGAQLYEAQCKVCHANGLLNAPKYGDKVAWASALAKDKETLYSHSAQGFNKMPAQAINGVSEAQVKAAVDYMLAAVS